MFQARLPPSSLYGGRVKSTWEHATCNDALFCTGPFHYTYLRVIKTEMAKNLLQSATISNCPSGFHNLWLWAQWKWWDEESGEETFLGMKLHRRKQKSDIGNYLRTSASLLHTPVPIKRPQTCLFFWWGDDGERFISVAWQSCHKTTLLQVGFRGLHSWLLKDIWRCPEQSWIPRTPSIIFRSGEDFLGRRVKLILATK